MSDLKRGTLHRHVLGSRGATRAEGIVSNVVRARALGLAVAILFSPAWLAAAGDEPTQPCVRSVVGRAAAGTIRLRAEGSPRAHQAVEDAVALWASCPGYGDAFARFATAGPARREIRVLLVERSSSLACATFSGDAIVLYDAAPLPDKRFVRCGSLARGLAHELGHVLGLLDAPDDHGCRDTIMAAFDPNGPTRSVTPLECAAVAAP